jgi:hypothetical protein
MPKVAKISISAAKTEQLAQKRLRAEGAYLRAIGSKEPRSVVSFAGSAMHIGSDRGAAAAVLCASGAGSYDYAEIAKAAREHLPTFSVADLSRTNLDYIANNFAFRCDLVGYAVSFDKASETIRVRVATADEKAAAIRKAAALTGRSFATVAAVSGFKAPAKAPARPRKAPAETPAPADEKAA